jgi:hypothetical protein
MILIVQRPNSLSEVSEIPLSREGMKVFTWISGFIPFLVIMN